MVLILIFVANSCLLTYKAQILHTVNMKSLIIYIVLYIHARYGTLRAVGCLCVQAIDNVVDEL